MCVRVCMLLVCVHVLYFNYRHKKKEKEKSAHYVKNGPKVDANDEVQYESVVHYIAEAEHVSGTVIFVCVCVCVCARVCVCVTLYHLFC